MRNILLGCALSMSCIAGTFTSTDIITISEIDEANDEETVISTQTIEVIQQNSSDYRGSSYTDPIGSILNFDNLGKVITSTRDIIGLGQEIYEIVKKGKPNVSVNFAPISVLPYNQERSGPVEVLQMYDWSPEPIVKKYRLTVDGVFGKNIDFIWKVAFYYGGTFDGKGRYITGAYIKHEKLDVAYGYTFNAAYKLQSVSFSGPQSDPVAQANIDLDFSYETLFKTSLKSHSYSLNGAGELKAL